MPWRASDSVSTAYQTRVASGEFVYDPAQALLARRFDQLLEKTTTRRLATKSSALGWLFARKAPANDAPLGLYVHGAVGRGKTMIMDMFFELVPAKRKRRAHFHDFMADVHARIHAHRQKLARGETRETDPVPPVASQLFADAWVLCFDEFSVTDIADAMLLGRLFEQLFQRGTVLVATSNVAPDDLYRDGLNRQLFLPFISLLKKRTEVVNLDARTDYRMEKTGKLPVYQLFSDANPDPLAQAWTEATAGRRVQPSVIERKGRVIPVPAAAGDTARFTFAELCEAPLGASDYGAIADRFPVLFIDRVPVMDLSQRNAAKRFIILVDTLYDRKARLFLSAEAMPDHLYRGTTGTEAFEFARTISRLTEMQSDDYLHGPKTSV